MEDSEDEEGEDEESEDEESQGEPTYQGYFLAFLDAAVDMFTDDLDEHADCFTV